jgi:predicted RNase H-like HicB family nuclease
MPRTLVKPRKQVVSVQHGYPVISEGLLEGGYQVIVPALPGIGTHGRTIAEARAMADDAIRCHLRALVEDGEGFPPAPFAPEPPICEASKYRTGWRGFSAR